jgi:hypothetical protein
MSYLMNDSALSSSPLSLNIAKLMPEFNTLIEGNFFTTDGLSALIISLLLMVFFWFLLKHVLVNYLKSIKCINFYECLLENIQVNTIAQLRPQLLIKAQTYPEYGNLWLEFDKTLIEQATPDQKNIKLIKTVDAAYYFNTASLAKNSTDNRLIASIPGILTAIGIIGTFAGLQLGLSNVNLIGADFQTTKAELALLIGSASIAFLTSLWGVTTSVIFNWIEKTTETRIKQRIEKLQNRIDQLFDTISTDQLLFNIEKHNQLSTHYLSDIGNTLGKELKQAITEMSHEMNSLITQAITESMNAALKPAMTEMTHAIQSVTNNQVENSEKILSSLIEQFIEGINKESDQQRDLMQQAGNHIIQAIEQFSTEFQSFLEQLNQQLDKTEQSNNQQQNLIHQQITQYKTEQSEQNEHFKTTLQNFIDHLKHEMNQQFTQNDKTHTARLSDLDQQLTAFLAEQSQLISQSIEQSVELNTHLTNNMNIQIEQFSNNDNERKQLFSQQIEHIFEHQQKMTEFINLSYEKNNAHVKNIIDQWDNISSGFTENHCLIEQLSNHLLNAATHIEQSSEHLKQQGTLVSNANNTLADSLTHASNITLNLSEENKHVLEEMNHLLITIDDLRHDFKQTAVTLNEASSNSSKSVDHIVTHQTILMQGLKNHLTELETQVAHLLQQYSTQVQKQTQDRFDEWNEQTKDFSQTLIVAIKTIADVVDEIESKTHVKK